MADAGDSAVLPDGELTEAGQDGTSSGSDGRAAGVPSATRLSREQAERLLQLIRDKEQQRRAARADALARERRRMPVRRDW
jgi:hypothetical protein